MADVIYGLVAFIVACYLLRWGFTYVVKRQRIDMTSERQRIQQDVTRAWHINKRFSHWLWKLSKHIAPQPPGKNKT